MFLLPKCGIRFGSCTIEPNLCVTVEAFAVVYAVLVKFVDVFTYNNWLVKYSIRLTDYGQKEWIVYKTNLEKIGILLDVSSSESKFNKIV